MCPATPIGYEYNTGKDSLGGDSSNPVHDGQVNREDWTKLADLCNKQNDCVAFNTDGLLKRALLPADSWTGMPGQCSGLLVKRTAAGKLLRFCV